MTPRNGLTSEKSRPQATATWSSFATRSLVGSRWTQPAASPHHTATQAWLASAQLDLLLGMDGSDVARDIGRREAVRAQGGDLDMGEVLADARLAGEHLGQ